MEGLFYSEKEHILFCIIGYTNKLSVVKLIEYLKKECDKLIKISDGDIQLGDIQTEEILESRQYAHMRVIYVKTTVVPEGAIKIKQPMQEFLYS